MARKQQPDENQIEMIVVGKGGNTELLIALHVSAKAIKHRSVSVLLSHAEFLDAGVLMFSKELQCMVIMEQYFYQQKAPELMLESLQ